MFNRYPTLRRVVVNTKTDRAFRGVVWRRRGGFLVLRNAEMLEGKERVVPLDGEILIESANVDFIQVL